MVASQIHHDQHNDLILRVFFIPFHTAGHIIPMVDAARLFARHGGVDVTVLTTEANAAVIRNSVDAEARAGGRIRVQTIRFPAEKVGLPAGVENLQAATSAEKMAAVGAGFKLLREPMERLLRGAPPDCLVTDTYLPWTAGFAAELGIPRLAFHASGYIQQCAEHCLQLHQPAGEDADGAVELPGLPGDIRLLRCQVPTWIKTRTDFTYFMDSMRAAEAKSFGAVFNSFTELESPFEDYYVNNMKGLRAWSIGPTFLAACGAAAKAELYDFAGGKTTEGEIMEWLSSKEKSSVLFVGFGSFSRFHGSQIAELAHGLEACGHPFVWAFFRQENDERCGGGGEGGDVVLPEGFLDRVKESGKGLVVRGWAPQKRILAHPAVGGMVTHCGWNSMIEGVAAGLPMLTWPLFADQFFNEKLAAEVLGIGVAVGVREWRLYHLGEETGDVVTRERVAAAARALMGSGKEAEERRWRARRLAEAAKAAVESGGSSHANLAALITELKSLKSEARANNNATAIA